MASFNKFNTFTQELVEAEINFNSDTFKVMLTNTGPVATNSTYSNISGTEVASGNGYTTGGTATTISLGNASGTETVSGTSVTWTATGSVGPLRYAVLYDSTAGYLVGWWDYGSSVTLNSGDTFEWNPASGIFTLA